MFLILELYCDCSDSNEKQGKHENEKHVKHEKRNFSFLARKSRPISVGSSADLSASMSSMGIIFHGNIYLFRSHLLTFFLMLKF